MTNTPLFHVDAFTERAFRGNPAGVVVLDADRDDAWLQSVAAELNLSETAFLRGSGGTWRLRWFTPTVEVDLCGHATLASAHALWESGRAAGASRLDFETKSGVLSAARAGEEIELDFPAERAVAVDPASLPPDLLASLGVASPRWIGKNRLDYVVEVASGEELSAITPDYRRLAAATRPARGVIVTTKASLDGFDFVSRYFAPAAGIDEDPVTGSAHCCLGPLWSERLGKNPVRGFQASRRGGAVGVRVEGSRVKLSGRAVIVVRGELV